MSEKTRQGSKIMLHTNRFLDMAALLTGNPAGLLNLIASDEGADKDESSDGTGADALIRSLSSPIYSSPVCSLLTIIDNSSGQYYWGITVPFLHDSICKTGYTFTI